MSAQRLTIPARGVTTASTFVDQPAQFCAPGQMRNVWPEDSPKQRRRGGTRWGTVPQLAGRVGSGPVQGMCRVIRPSSAGGYTIDKATDLTAGGSKAAGALGGNLFQVDSLFATEWAFDIPIAGTSPTRTANTTAFSQDGSKVVSALNHTVGGFLRSTVVCVDAATGAQLWTHDIAAAADRFVNALVCTRTYVAIATNNAVRLLNLTTGALVEEKQVTWAQEVVAIGYATAAPAFSLFGSGATGPALFVAFNGSTAAGTIVGGVLPDGTVVGSVIEAGISAQHFRSGVMRFDLVELDFVGPPPASKFTQVRFGQQLPAGHPLREADHQYFRLSEQSFTRPYGAAIQGMAVNPDGSIVLIRTNRGWGPDTGWRPGWALEPDARKRRAPVTVCAIARTGEMLWEMDPASEEGPANGSGTYVGNPHFNDIVDPLMRAVAVAADGTIYIGGRRSSLGKSAWAINSSSSVRWAMNLVNAGGFILEGALAVDPSDGSPIFGGTRNNVWDGATGQAHAWKVNPVTAQVVRSLDFGAAVSVAAVACNASGQVALGTDRF